MELDLDYLDSNGLTLAEMGGPWSQQEDPLPTALVVEIDSYLKDPAEPFHLLVHSSDANKSKIWARPKSGARDCAWSPTQVPGTQAPGWTVFHCFPRSISRGLDERVTGISTWDGGITNHGL